MNNLTLQFSVDHPTAPGHFPDNPIIPGALLLAEVLQVIGDAAGKGFVPFDVISVKFQHPVRPGDNVDISYSPAALMNFKCTVTGVLVMSGVISAAMHA